MGESEAVSLRDLRDACRDTSSIPDVDTLVQLLSTALSDLGIHPSSRMQSTSSSLPPGKQLDRQISTIQSALASSVYPTFCSTLDSQQLELLEAFFVPPLATAELAVRRAVALSSYHTIYSLLSSTGPGVPPLPVESRPFILETASRAAQIYGIDQLYWGVFGKSSNVEEGSKDASMRELRWEEAVKAMIGLPGRAANSVGKWKADGWNGDLPEGLLPRRYFERLAIKLELLMYELSQRPDNKNRMAAIRLILERLIALRLVGPPRRTSSDPQPSILTAIIPSLLSHLRPSSTFALPPYPPDYLPRLILSLPTSEVVKLIASIVQHLAYRLADKSGLLPDAADERIKRAAIVLEQLIGPARVDSEAYEAILRHLVHAPARDATSAEHRTTGIRLMVAWASKGGDSVMHHLTEALLEAWISPKYIKFALFAEQYHLTSAVLLAVSYFPQYSAYLKTLSHRSTFITSVQSYLSHPDPSIRRLGMLVAEIFSERTIPASADDNQAEPDDDIAAMKADLEGTDNIQVRAPRPTSLKRLRFIGMWDGNGEGREECRVLRQLVGVKDNEAALRDSADDKDWMLGWVENQEPHEKSSGPSRPEQRTMRPTPHSREARQPRPKRQPPKIVMLDPEQTADPLSGYASASPSSSRASSPTQEYLDEVAEDPSLALDSVAKKKISRPVYIQQLWALLKEREKPEELEVALQWGEGLVRAKRNFGRELEEYAEHVANMAMALNSSFNIEGFEEKRQGLLNALVSCAPKQIAPCLCESYFTGHYSLQQRSIMLTALAMGARELAGLPTLQPATHNRQIDFPTKTLPPALHRKYISAVDLDQETPSRQPDQLEAAISGVRDLMLSKGAKRAEAEPEIAREKRLRVGRTRDKRTIIAEVGTLQERQMGAPTINDLPRTTNAARPVVPFKDVAADYFIMPLINRFWAHWQDSSARESRAAAAGSGYKGAGTGMLLSPLAVEKLVTTIALLLHAARHSPSFLHVLAPEGLELALTVGARQVSRPSAFEHESSLPTDRAEASVLGACLELALVCLDTSFDLDQGRTLAADHGAPLLATGEWAQAVFETEERGGAVAAGQGGMREGRVRVAAAGVVVKVAEMGEKWGHLGLGR